MNFLEVCNFFGGSIFYEDLRGNLTTINTQLDQCQARTALVCVDDAASILLLRGLWNILSGNFRVATQYLESLADTDVWGIRWSFRAHAHIALLHTWKEHPPLFRPCDISGPSKKTWKSRIPGNEAMDAAQFCNGLVKDMPGMIQLEFRVIIEVCTFYQATFNFARCLNPASEDYDDHETKRAEKISAVEKAGVRILKLVQTTLTRGLPFVAAYLLKLLYDISHARGGPDASTVLEMMRELYTTLEDPTGLGFYWLVRGDHNASPAFTSPLILNLDIIDSSDEFGGDSQIFLVSDQYEFPSKLGRKENHGSTGRSSVGSRHESLSRHFDALKSKIQHLLNLTRIPLDRLTRRRRNDSNGQQGLEQAMKCYKKALQHFSAAGSIRGSASATLRIACLQIISNMLSSMFWPQPSISQNTNEEVRHAQKMSSRAGDTQLTKLVTTHALLIENMTPDKKIVARALAQWAEECDSEVFGVSLVLLGMKKASYFRYHTGLYQPSFVASEFSRQVVKTFGRFKYLWYQVMLFQISLLKSVGLQQQTRVWIGHLKDWWFRMCADCLNYQVEVELTSGEQDKELQFQIAKLALQNTIAAIIPVEFNDVAAQQATDTSVVEEIFGWISKNFQDSMTTEWIHQQRLRIAYYLAMASYRKHCREGEFGKANRSLVDFLEAPLTRERVDLQSRLLVIDASLAWGDYDTARQLLATVDDNDRLPQLYTILGRGRRAEIELLEQRLSLKSLEGIFLACVKSREWPRARRLMGRLEVASSGYFTGIASYTKLMPWKRCLYAGLVLENEQQYNEANLYFLQAWFFFDCFQRYFVFPDERRSIWTTPEVGRIVSSLTRRQILWKKDQPGVTKLEPTSDARIDTKIFRMFSTSADYGRNDHLNEALLFLERGRPEYVWYQTMNQDMATQPLASAYYQYQLWMELKGRGTLDPEEELELQILDAEIAEITRVLEGAAPSLMESAKPSGSFPFSIQQLFAAIPEDAIVIYYAVSDDGFTALSVDHKRVWTVVWDPSITPKMLQMSVQLYLGAVLDSTPYGQNEGEDFDALRLHRNILSKILIEPMNGTISKRSHIIFIPSGDLARLPFGALHFKDEYLILQRQVSQVPSLAALFDLRFNRRPLARRSASEHLIQVVARPGNPRDNFLPMAGVEAKLIAHLTGTTAIDAKDVTRADFRSIVCESDIVHVCTHGFIDANRTLNSYLLLRERFRVLDMLAVRTEVALVTFSACLSGQGDTTDGGDVQGFSHALLAAGANAYLGALWEVNDVATMIHMHLFYITLLVSLEGPSIAEAWHIATKILYHYTTEDAVFWAESAINTWNTWEERGENPNAFVKNGKKKLEALVQGWREGKEEMVIDFKHPKIWASFVLVGNGSLQIGSSTYYEFQEHRRRMRNI